MKYKKLTENQILISIDRLTRFKQTEEKYLRVFKDIIISNLIEPKYKKSEIDSLSYKEIKNIAVEIFNNSLIAHNTDNHINKYLQEYENSVFYNDKNVNELLNNEIDYVSAIPYITVNCAKNLLWLKELYATNDIKKQREKKDLLFPIEIVVLVEGITEEILLPKFAKILDFPFEKYGIKVIAAGGKNQVVKLYYSLAEQLKIPMFVLLDKDAVENVELINKHLRTIDKVHLLECGEFEDLLPKHLIHRTINSHLKNFSTVTLEELSDAKPMVKILEEIFKEKGLHEFKKAEFAHLIHDNIKNKDDISEEITKIIIEISDVIKSTKSLI